MKIFHSKKNKITKIAFTLSLLIGILFSYSFHTSPDPQKDKVLIGVLRYILKNGHYEPRELDDHFSKAIYKKFINEIDPIKRYFTQEDIHDFAVYETEIDNQLKREDLSFYNLVMDRFEIRFDESEQYYNEVLDTKFDFTKDEEVDIDYDNLKYAKNEAGLKEYWRKQMKLSTLNRIQSLTESENDKFLEDSTYIKKPFDTLEVEARAKIKENIQSFYKRVRDLDHTDWFATFANSLVEEFDPHTTYFAPKVKELFDINISGKIEGIGARLQEKNDYTKVVELISGGPAWKQGDLEVGDLIIKVAQEGEESKDIVGMRLDDAIKLIKGKKGTKVTLTVKKVDNTISKITIIRDVVELEETFVKSSTVIKNDKKFGVINLPKFYINFEDENFRNSTTDMIKEIENLKKENIDGLLIDLRNNGGGSLKTAIEIGGLFIE